MGQHEWSSFTGFRMSEEEVPVSAFDPHHRRLGNDPASSFVQTLVVQKPMADRIVTLRARTLSSIGPTVAEKRLVEADEFAEVLRDVFGITVGGERLARLWAKAVEQHEAFLARS